MHTPITLAPISQASALEQDSNPSIAATNNNQLEIIALDKTYPNGTKALNKINLTLSNGLFGLLGPNGAGKSSLMRSLATLQSVDSGKIIFNGVDIQTNPQLLRQCLGYLPQEFGVYPRVSAFKLLDYLAILKGVINKQQRHQQINDLLKLTNLYQHRFNAVAEYSGGMRQRFGIAQALLGSPKILIIDEPTAGLDPSERNAFHNCLSDIAEKMIVLLSTHIVEDINNLCPRMAILNAGKIEFQGCPKSLIKRLENKLWGKTVKAEELLILKDKYQILSTRLISGLHQVRVVSDTNPESAFTAISADLEDAYFYSLNQSKNNINSEVNFNLGVKHA